MSAERAREIYRDLQKLARADYHGATGPLLVVYGVEGFLRRLAASEHATKMTLKGGMLMAATATRRMTKDAELAAVGVANDPEHIAGVVAGIVTVELPGDDGLAFDVDTIRTEIMREQADYHGVRTRIQARLATAKPTITLDFSFGDPHRSGRRPGLRSKKQAQVSRRPVQSVPRVASQVLRIRRSVLAAMRS